jgi:hypothetical protein
MFTTLNVTVIIFWDGMTCVRNAIDSNVHGYCVVSQKIVIFKSNGVHGYDFLQLSSFNIPFYTFRILKHINYKYSV